MPKHVRVFTSIEACCCECIQNIVSYELLSQTLVQGGAVTHNIILGQKRWGYVHGNPLAIHVLPPGAVEPTRVSIKTCRRYQNVADGSADNLAR